MDMTTKRLILFFLLFLPLDLYCQTIRFNYDANGNRITRTLIPLQLKSAIIDFPVQYPDKLDITDKQKESILEGELRIKIYPNPTKGILKIEIINLPEEEIPALRLYDLSGLELINLNNLSPIYNLDISNYIDGIYILRIIINDKVTNWKVIKN
jgi:hypothetical protein